MDEYNEFSAKLEWAAKMDIIALATAFSVIIANTFSNSNPNEQSTVDPQHTTVISNKSDSCKIHNIKNTLHFPYTNKMRDPFGKMDD